jgi:glycerol-3-phosphate acyltransferase PlsY
VTLLYWLVASYLLGSIPTSLIVSRYIARIELRHMGSGNLGATNVYRVLGWKYAIPVFILDAAKGVIPVAIFGYQTTALGTRWTPIVMGIAAILGHVFSLFASFKGGKGVATTCGVVLALAPIPTAVSLAVWGVLSGVTGYVSVGSIIGSSIFPIVAWIVYPGDTILTGAGLLMAGFLVFNHRANIARLRAGTESRIRPPKGAN